MLDLSMMINFFIYCHRALFLRKVFFYNDDPSLEWSRGFCAFNLKVAQFVQINDICIQTSHP